MNIHSLTHSGPHYFWYHKDRGEGGGRFYPHSIHLDLVLFMQICYHWNLRIFFQIVLGMKKVSEFDILKNLNPNIFILNIVLNFFWVEPHTCFFYYFVTQLFICEKVYFTLFLWESQKNNWYPKMISVQGCKEIFVIQEKLYLTCILVHFNASILNICASTCQIQLL